MLLESFLGRADSVKFARSSRHEEFLYSFNTSLIWKKSSAVFYGLPKKPVRTDLKIVCTGLCKKSLTTRVACKRSVSDVSGLGFSSTCNVVVLSVVEALLRNVVEDWKLDLHVSACLVLPAAGSISEGRLSCIIPVQLICFFG